MLVMLIEQLTNDHIYNLFNMIYLNIERDKNVLARMRPLFTRYIVDLFVASQENP